MNGRKLAPLFVLLLLLRPAAGAETRTILFFGDSLTAGYGLEDPQTQAYPALIQDKIDSAGLPWRVVNAGVSGNTTADGVRRIDWALRQPVAAFVLALGANDGLRGLDPVAARANLETIAERVRARYPGARIVIAGMMLPPSMGADYARSFAAIFPEVAAKEQAVLIPFLLEGVGGRPELNQADGIHPVAKGDAIIAETVWKAIEPILRER